MDKLVSVIVPVYNTKEFLDRCIKSIQNQTHQELEIIIVDDGSTDGSSEICDLLQQEDKRIVVIHKENGGVVSARKKGFERARGDYSITIDSDDWIEPEMIAKMYELAIANQADFVTSGYCRECDGTYSIITDGVKEGVYSEQSCIEYIYRNLIYMNDSKQYGINGSLWNKLIETSLMREMHLKLSEEIDMREDAAIVYSCCIRAKKLVVTHDVFYHYNMRFGSAVSSSHPYFLRSANELYLFLRGEMEKSDYRDILLSQLDKYIVEWIFRGISYYMGLSKEMAIPYYDFDKSIINKNAKVILYGAGKIGQSYYKQICADKLYQLEGWIDKNYLYYQEKGLNVLPINELERIECDYIILALQCEDMAEEIKQGLINKYKLSEDKFIWFEPISILEKYQLKDRGLC